VKDIVGSKPVMHTSLLLFAWMAWGVSVACVLASFYSSQQALRQAISQVDKGQIYRQTAGGVHSQITTVLNAAGGVLFLVGIVLIVIFASQNLR
jgi:hypothetical protein